MRKNRHYGNRRPAGYKPNFRLYEELKADWMRRHPAHSREQYEQMMKEFAQRCGI